MPNHIPEEYTTAFTCPNCEIARGENNLAKKVDNHFLCSACGSTYPNREAANRLRDELRVR